MGRIVRLTERDLTRIVRRVINEGMTGEQILTSINSLIGSASITNWWNKSKILTEIDKISSCDVFMEMYKRCKSMGYGGIKDYIIAKLDTGKDYDADQAAYITNPAKNLGTGLTDEEFNVELGKKLGAWGSKCFAK